MRIGIDLDGVVFDSENWFKAYSEIFDVNINGKGVVNPNCIRAQHRYDWTQDQIKQYFDDCMEFIQKTAPLMPYAKYVLDKLAENNQIYFITRRGVISDIEKTLTRERLAKENIKFDNIFFSQSSKLDTCKKMNIDYMIDDYHKVVTELTDNGIKCIYFKSFSYTPLNKKNVLEVSDWGEIYRFFFDKNKKSK